MKNIITIILILILPVMVYFMINKNSSDLSALAEAKNIPTFITFSSAMCVDCRKMKPIISELEKEYSGKVNFISVNATEKDKKIQNLVKKYNVVLVPTMIILDSDNNELSRLEGYIPKEELASDIEDAIND